MPRPDVQEQVRSELKAMKDVGMNVPDSAFYAPRRELLEYEENGMSISEIADLVISLAPHQEVK
jgi:hypothetical protein